MRMSDACQAVDALHHVHHDDLVLFRERFCFLDEGIHTFLTFSLHEHQQFDGSRQRLVSFDEPI